jgi:hypothetical protein
MNVSALAGSSRTAVRDAAGDAAQGQRTLKSAFSSCPRPPCSKRVSGHCHRSCDGLAVSTQLTNRADCQHVVVVSPRAAWTQWRPRAFWILWRRMCEFCRGVIGHIGPTKTSELITTTPGSCRYQPIALPSDHVSLALKSRSMLGLSFTTGKGQAQSRGASFRQPSLDEVLPQMVPIRCIFVGSQNSWREPLKRGQRIKSKHACHGCPGLVRMP